MRHTVTNTLNAALNTLVFRGALKADEAQQYRVELSTPHLRRYAYDELTMRFGLQDVSGDGTRFAFSIPVTLHSAQTY